YELEAGPHDKKDGYRDAYRDRRLEQEADEVADRIDAERVLERVVAARIIVLILPGRAGMKREYRQKDDCEPEEKAAQQRCVLIKKGFHDLKQPVQLLRAVAYSLCR